MHRLQSKSLSTNRFASLRVTKISRRTKLHQIDQRSISVFNKNSNTDRVKAKNFKDSSIEKSPANDWDNTSISTNQSVQKKFGCETILNKTKPIRTPKNQLENKKKKTNFFNCRLARAIPIIVLIVVTVTSVIVASVLISINLKKTSTVVSIATNILASCRSLCANETWTFNSDVIAQWTFDGTFADTRNTYDATGSNNPSFSSIGYINQALLLNTSMLQGVSASYIPLTGTNFTIEAWIRPTDFPNSMDHAILGLCPSLSSNQCLHTLIRKNGSNYFLHFGFSNNDCQGVTSIALNQWSHVTFVFNFLTMKQSIYLNGLLDNDCSTTSSFIGSLGDVTIGYIPALFPRNGFNFYQGLIDHVSITRRAKAACEILEDASLVGCFLFDSPNPLIDSGPNNLLTNSTATSAISFGQSGQALSYDGTSFFQATSLTSLGQSNTAYSFLIWIRPRAVNRTIVHVSDSSTGIGWCIPYIGIHANGSIVGQHYLSAGNLGSLASSSSVLFQVWTHIAQTWSVTDGLRLYINGRLDASLVPLSIYSGSSKPNYVTLAGTSASINICYGGALGSRAPGQFDGDMDDFRIYNRALSTSEVYLIYQDQ